MSGFFPDLSGRLRVLIDTLPARVVVIGHSRPDGDCIGSQVGLARILCASGREVVCANPDPVPRRLAYLVKEEPVVLPDALPAGEWSAVLVDCADLSRIGRKLGERFPKPAASIDHHLSNNHGAVENLVDAAAAATAEMLAGMALDLGLELDTVAAKALYAGILTDTGQFRFGSTSRRVFQIVARLLDMGADPSEAGGEIYERESFGRMRLLQKFLSSLKLECGGRVCVGILHAGVFEETGTSGEDTEGLVDYTRAIDGVDIGVLLEERPGMTKGSLRSRDPIYRLDQVAAKFSGGGHACAAGINHNTPLAEIYPQILTVLAAQIARADAGKTR
ncbi:MAG TPA: bifunctional oligoribonuclease/PAP phosphatase NrnA [Opitutaceae bacterium]